MCSNQPHGAWCTYLKAMAHGYLTLSPDSEVFYLTSHPYAPEAAYGVRYDDPVFGIAFRHRSRSSRRRIGPGLTLRYDGEERRSGAGDRSQWIHWLPLSRPAERSAALTCMQSHAIPTELASAGVRWHAANLLETAQIAKLIDAVQPTHLLHLAWFVVPGRLITAAENFDWVTSSLQSLQRFADAGGGRALMCGSAYEYDWRYGYCSEELTPRGPTTVYGGCKLALYEMASAMSEPAPRIPPRATILPVRPSRASGSPGRVRGAQATARRAGSDLARSPNSRLSARPGRG